MHFSTDQDRQQYLNFDGTPYGKGTYLHILSPSRRWREALNHSAFVKCKSDISHMNKAQDIFLSFHGNVCMAFTQHLWRSTIFVFEIAAYFQVNAKDSVSCTNCINLSSTNQTIYAWPQKCKETLKDTWVESKNITTAAAGRYFAISIA